VVVILITLKLQSPDTCTGVDRAACASIEEANRGSAFPVVSLASPFSIAMAQNAVIFIRSHGPCNV
jgi:hypothetical protein